MAALRRVVVDGRIPDPREPGFVRSLLDVLRDLATQLDLLTRDVMARANHSSALTADALVRTGAATYRGYMVLVATATATIDIRDATAAGGGSIIATIPAATAVGAYPLSVGIACDLGVFADYNGAATGTIVVLFE